MRSAALRRLLVTAALTNVALSATEVSLTAYARDHDALWASGPLLAAVSAGSIAGSLLLGARRPPGGRASAPVPAGSSGPRPGAAAEAGGGCGARAAARPAPRGGYSRRLPRLLAGYALGLAGLTASRPVLGLALAAGAAVAAAASAAAIGRRPGRVRA